MLMSEFLDFTRDSAYLERQLQRVIQRLDSTNRELGYAITEANIAIRKERIRTYQWMIDEIKAELTRRAAVQRAAQSIQ